MAKLDNEIKKYENFIKKIEEIARKVDIYYNACSEVALNEKKFQLSGNDKYTDEETDKIEKDFFQYIIAESSMQESLKKITPKMQNYQNFFDDLDFKIKQMKLKKNKLSNIKKIDKYIKKAESIQNFIQVTLNLALNSVYGRYSPFNSTYTKEEDGTININVNEGIFHKVFSDCFPDVYKNDDDEDEFPLVLNNLFSILSGASEINKSDKNGK